MTQEDHHPPAAAVPEPEPAGATPASRAAWREQMTRAAQRSGDFVRQQARYVEARARQQPWPILATAFVAGILFGYILGNRRR